MCVLIYVNLCHDTVSPSLFLIKGTNDLHRPLSVPAVLVADWSNYAQPPLRKNTPIILQISLILTH